MYVNLNFHLCRDLNFNPLCAVVDISGENLLSAEILLGVSLLIGRGSFMESTLYRRHYISLSFSKKPIPNENHLRAVVNI